MRCRRLMQIAIAASVGYGGFGLASAQEQSSQSQNAGCAGLAWPLQRERGWFDDPKLPKRDSGTRLRRIDRAVDLALKPSDKVRFFLPPLQQPRADSYSGEITFFGVPHPGLYQVTLSADADVGVFENGTRLQFTGTTHTQDCPGLRTSVRFNLAPGDLVLVQVTNASSPSIKVAFSEAH
jgi:hypothetical protein